MKAPSAPTSSAATFPTSSGVPARFGLRLLTRTTRNIAPTEAGERIIQAVGPKLDEVDAELAALTALRDTPGGTVRLCAGEHAAELILWPAVRKLPPHYPDIKVEIIIDNGLTDIVAERLDAGTISGTSFWSTRTLLCDSNSAPACPGTMARFAPETMTAP